MTQIWIRSFGISAFILCSSERFVLPACALWPIDRRRSYELSEWVGWWALSPHRAFARACMRPMSRLHAPYCNSSIIPSPPALATYPPTTRLPMQVSPIHHLAPRSATTSATAHPIKSGEQGEGIFRSPDYVHGRGWKSMPNEADDPVMYLAGDPRTACPSALAEERHIGLRKGRATPGSGGRWEGRKEGGQEGIWNKATRE